MNRRTLLKLGTVAIAPWSRPLQSEVEGALAQGQKQSAFPKDFLWGAGTAAHQVEGNDVNSDIWTLEHLAESMFKEPSGDACDHYNLFEQDIAMLADLGLNTYRFSLNWARIEPSEGEFSMTELAHYRRMLEVCQRHEVTPMVTFVHVATPRWFAFDGGWTNPASIERYARFCDRSAKHLGDLMAWAATLNEPNLIHLLSWVGLPGGKRLTDLLADSEQLVRKQVKADHFSTSLGGNADLIQKNMLRAHEAGRAAIKAVYPKLPVGLTLAMEDDQPSGEHSRMEEKHSTVYQPWLQLARKDDFIGVQTYGRQLIGEATTNLPPKKDAELTQSGMEFYPEALENTIRYASKETGVPVVVTENGVATEDDLRRVEYIKRAVAGVERCLADKIDVRGYVHWSLLDNFEWVSGYGPKFGIVAVDRSTQRRTIKPSAAYLGKLAVTSRASTV